MFTMKTCGTQFKGNFVISLQMLHLPMTERASFSMPAFSSCANIQELRKNVKNKCLFCVCVE